MVKVKYAFKFEVDFGMLSAEYTVGEIDVKPKQWHEYLALRMAYEIAHDKLCKKMKKRHQKQFKNIPREVTLLGEETR